MKLLRNLSIGQKIGSIVITLVSLLIATSVFGIIKVSAIGHEMKTIQAEDMPLIELVSDVTLKQLEKTVLIEKAMRIAGISDSNQSVGELHHSITELAHQIEKEIKQGEAILVSAKTHALSDQQSKELIKLEQDLKAIEIEHRVFEQKAEALMTQLDQHTKVTAQQVEELEQAQDKLNHHLAALLVGVEKLSEHALETVHHDEERALQGMIWLSITSSIVGIVFGIFITRAITKPLAQAVDTAKRLSDGDLTVQIDIHATDETGQLLTAMQQMAQKLRDMISQIAAATDQLTSATHELSAVTTQTAQNIEAQKENLHQTSVAVNEMSATVQEVASNAAQTAASTSQAEDETQLGRSVVEQVNGAILDLAVEIEHSKEAITRLDSETENVDAILNVITSIAEQTNLLALNAAIEAARAGEQGRGFAVVADEVRTLASRTQDSITEIQQMTGRLKSEANACVKAMENGQNKANATVELSGQAGISLVAIGQAVTAINEMNLQIASASEQQSAVAEQVNQSVTQINEAANENNAGAQQVAVATDEIAQLSINLKSLVGQFKTT